MYHHVDNKSGLEVLGHLFTEAAKAGSRMRIETDDRGRVRYKAGEGMWSHWIESSHDPYRDLSGS